MDSNPAAFAFIFDVDGVIVDSNPVHSLCWREYLSVQGLKCPPDFDRNMFGKRNDDILRDLLGSVATDAEIASHGAAKEALYRDMMRPVLQDYLIPGLVSFLEKHAGVPKGVASNAERANVEFVLDSAGLREYFSAVLTGDHVARPKPDPEIYLKAAGLLGIQPQNCFVFEDSAAGVEAARSAGARVVGISTSHANLANTDLLIGDFLDPELEEWLGRQKARN